MAEITVSNVVEFARDYLANYTHEPRTSEYTFIAMLVERVQLAECWRDEGLSLTKLAKQNEHLQAQRDAAVAILRRADVERQSPAGLWERRNLVHVGFIHDALVALDVGDAKEGRDEQDSNS